MRRVVGTRELELFNIKKRWPQHSIGVDPITREFLFVNFYHYNHRYLANVVVVKDYESIEKCFLTIISITLSHESLKSIFFWE